MGCSAGTSCTILFVTFLFYGIIGAGSGVAQPAIAEMNMPAPMAEVESFSATPFQGYVELTWTSVREVGIIGYQVNRRVRSFHDSTGSAAHVNEWETLSFIKGKGFPDAEADYAFADTLNTPVGGGILYRLLQVHEDGATEIVEDIRADEPLPRSFSAKTYTRPDNPIVTIEYKLPEKVRVKVYAYNSSGSYSELLINKIHEPGNHREYFDGSERKSGLYICKIVAGKETWIEPMLLIK